MLHLILTVIRIIFKLIFLPVRAVLHIIAFVLKTLLALGTVASSVIFFLFVLGAVAAAILGDYRTAALGFGVGLVFKALPYAGAVIVSIPLTVAEFLEQITSAHPFEIIDGGNYNEV